MKKSKIAVVGAGPKAVAIATKANVLKQLGIVDVAVEIFEEHEVAANWDGSYGHTDGKQTLGTPPEKDIGFPYESKFGEAVDAELFKYSWESYLVSQKKYADYIDRGKPHPFHVEWADYLRWVADKSNLNIIPRRVVEVDLSHNNRFSVRSFKRGEKVELEYDGIVFTGPGAPLQVGNRGHDWIASKIIDGQEFWTNLHLFRELSEGRVAIIGAGETAASIAVALIREAPNVEIEIVNRSGTLYTRGEGYHENELYTNPDKWRELDELDRQDFIRRTDRGVFSVESKKTIDQASNIRTITGTVLGIERRRRTVQVEIERLNRKREYSYDLVIVAIGFDPYWPLDLLPDSLRENFPTSNRTKRREAAKKIHAMVDYHFRLTIPFDMTGNGSYRNFHVPMLAALRQGPGFPNLSCLGRLSDRVLSTYIENHDPTKWHCAEPDVDDNPQLS